MPLFTRKKIDASIEKHIVTGMICSDEFLREVRGIYKPGLFSIRLSEVIADWCLECYDKTEKAPFKDIEKILLSKSREMNDELADKVSEFLSDLSSKWEQEKSFNHKYLLSEAEKFFRRRSIERLSAEVSGLADEGDLDKAEELIGGFKQVRIKEGSSINPLVDHEAIQQAFDEDEENSLIKFSGRLGELLNEHLIREGFIGIMAPEKRGKTWWLIEFALMALKSRSNVAFFQVGDMGQDEFVTRFASRLSRKPALKKYTGEFYLPCKDCRRNQLDDCSLPERQTNGVSGLSFPHSIVKELETKRLHEIIKDEVGYVPCTACKKDFVSSAWYKKHHVENKIEWREAYRRFQKLSRWTNGRQLKVSTHPNSSLSVSGIETILENWEIYDSFTPDVIIIDYADILASDYKGEFRHQENEKWKALRRLSQSRKSLVITATQTDTDAYKKKSISLDNFSEDKRKYAHVTGMLALNQTPEEKEACMMRLNWILLREGEFGPDKGVAVAQSIRIGQPLLFSI